VPGGPRYGGVVWAMSPYIRALQGGRVPLRNPRRAEGVTDLPSVVLHSSARSDAGSTRIRGKPPDGRPRGRTFV
jgi:hypothetical protein